MHKTQINASLIEAILRCDHMANKVAENTERPRTELQRVRNVIAAHHSQRCKEILQKTYQVCNHRTPDEFINLPKSDEPLVAFDFRVKNHEVDFTADAAILRRVGAKKLSIEPIFFSVNRRLDTTERHFSILRSLLMEQVFGSRISKASIFLLGTERPIRMSVKTRAIEQRALESLKVLASGDQKKTHAVMIPFCKQCPFEKLCVEELKSRDDLSLLGGISKNEIKGNQSRGIFTVNQLSHSYRPRRRPEGAKPKYYPSLRAMAIREAKVYVVQKPIIQEAKIAVFVDVEGLPDIDFYYLIGVHVRTSRGTKTYSFWANGPDEERENWFAFLRFLRELKHYHLFHYGSYEKIFFDKMRKRYRLTDDDVQTFDTLRGAMVNVVSLIYGQIYFPTYTNGLKDIGAYLGATWSQDASGLLSIAWRDAWDLSERSEFKTLIEKYNSDDCAALARVLDFVRQVSEPKQDLVIDGKPVGSASDVRLSSSYRWGNTSFLIPELDTINKCAYFDYQSTKIVFGKRTKKIRPVSRKTKEQMPLRANKKIFFDAPLICPSCGSEETWKHGYYKKSQIDLKISNGGVKRWIVKYVARRRSCKLCRHVYLSKKFPTKEPLYGRTLEVFVCYLNIALRLSFGEIREYFKRILGMDMSTSTLSRMKQSLAAYYKPTVNHIWRSVRTGKLLQVDETNAKLDGKGCYVWTFATLTEVVFIYAENRKGDILHNKLKNFNGVLVSDFFAAYDSVPCQQQKCLIHLIRDLNDDLFRNQLNDEFKEFVTDFAQLMKRIVETIDKWDLRKRYLIKHKRDVRRYFRRIAKREYQTEISRQYQKRLLKNEDRLFTFLNYDNVPWNNNYAENAIKTFAEFRRKFNRTFQKDGLQEYLVLLSIQQTCKLQKINFLQFLLSGRKTLPPGGGR